jgi:putative transposase
MTAGSHSRKECASYLVQLETSSMQTQPAQRHKGVDAELLAKREAVYERANNLNPKCWSGDIRNWTVAGAVSLKPGKLQEIERNKQAA